MIAGRVPAPLPRAIGHDAIVWFGTCTAFLGADDDLRFMVRRIRQVWPDMEIHVRADCGFGVPLMYRTCEELGVTYTIGIGMNATLKAASDE